MLRRQFSFLLPLLVKSAEAAGNPALASQFHPYEELPVMGTGSNHFRPILKWRVAHRLRA